MRHHRPRVRKQPPLQRQQLRRQPLKPSEVNHLLQEFDVLAAVGEAAYVLYRRAMEAHVFRNIKPEVIAAAAVYGACRRYGVSITFEGLAEHSGASRRAIGRMIRWLFRELKLGVPPLSSRAYLPRLCQQLAVAPLIQSTADDILRRAEATGVTAGRSPTGLAAAALYIASRQHNQSIMQIPQQDIAEVAGVTTVTIRNRYQELVSQLDLSL